MATSFTLRQFFDEQFRPFFLADARPRTMEQHLETLALWQTLTDNPPLTGITNATLARFRCELLKRRSRRTKEETLSPGTANKHLRHVQAVLAKAGPPGPGNRDALGLIATAPWCKPLRQDLDDPLTITDAELRAIYGACDAAWLPDSTEYSPPAWWRAAIVVSYNIAVRWSALLRLRWDQVDFTSAEIRVQAKTTKGRRGAAKPLNPCVLQHLLRIRTATELVFTWPHAKTTFRTVWRAIQKTAGIADGDMHQWHGLKRTCGTVLSGQEDLWVVQRMLDHASIQTSQRYASAATRMRPATDRMPQPWGQTQLELFPETHPPQLRKEA